LSCQDFHPYFGEVIGALSICKSPKHILKMEESGVRARPFKGRGRKVVSLISCPVEPHSQDIWDLSHVSVLATVSLGLNSFPPLFLTVSNINSWAPELCTMPGDLQPSI
jgi:hypothetical protein